MFPKDGHECLQNLFYFQLISLKTKKNSQLYPTLATKFFNVGTLRTHRNAIVVVPICNEVDTTNFFLKGFYRFQLVDYNGPLTRPKRKTQL